MGGETSCCFSAERNATDRSASALASKTFESHLTRPQKQAAHSNRQTFGPTSNNSQIITSMSQSMERTNQKVDLKDFEVLKVT